MHAIRVALAQIELSIGGFDTNLAALAEAYTTAANADADLVVFPELAICGPAPRDLLLLPHFLQRCTATLAAFAATTARTAALVGAIEVTDAGIYNVAALCARGEVQGVYRKRMLADYASSSGHRYFLPGGGPPTPFEIAGVRVGVAIGDDALWPTGPLVTQIDAGAQLGVALGASPFRQGIGAKRHQMLGSEAREHRTPIVYVNPVGSYDGLVYDGGSLVSGADGTLLARAPQFAPSVIVCDVPVATAPRRTEALAADPMVAAGLAGYDELYQALVYSTRSYVTHNGFSDVVIGLSGGVDSALVATIAVDALGADHVHCVSMPSRFSSEHSRADAAELAGNLGVDFRTVSIEPAFQAFIDMLSPAFVGRAPGVTYENLQSRSRGQTLMALSNEFGWMALTTGNKSEIAVGYFTLYGDSVGGFAPICDVYKVDVFELCRHVNRQAHGERIPVSIITKPPSAELRPDQRDDQSLPDYATLDPLLADLIDFRLNTAELVDRGHDPVVADRVSSLVRTAEHKRRQLPPGVQVTSTPFGVGRQMPVTHRYRS